MVSTLSIPVLSYTDIFYNFDYIFEKSSAAKLLYLEKVKINLCSQQMVDGHSGVPGQPVVLPATLVPGHVNVYVIVQRLR